MRRLVRLAAARNKVLQPILPGREFDQQRERKGIMASVRRHVSASGKVSFQAVWNLVTKDGRRKRMSKSFAKQSDARAHAAKMEAECEKRGVGDAERQTFDQFKDRVLKHWELRGKLEETTLAGYRHNLGMLAREIGHIELGKLNALHIDEALTASKAAGGASRKPAKEGEKRNTRPLSDRTLLHIYRVGSTAMEQARKWKLVSANPFKDVEAPRPRKKKIVIMNEEQAAQVYRRAVIAHESGKHPGMDLLVGLLFTTGIRRSEILGLAFDAIDLDACTISIFRTVVAGEKGAAVLRDHRTKSETSERVISFPPELVPMVKRHRQWVSEAAMKWGRKNYRTEPLLLFPTFGGEPLTPVTLSTRLRQLHRQAKVVGVMPTHGFRHGMASHLIADGTDVKTVADRLGHATVAFTLATYVHTVDGRDRAAAQQLGAKFGALREAAEKG
ncbi:tyrosine-type recombinase/integrase [Sinorhizobium medicae]|nr:tyrosine-type recombinase/integrase [Sinorhizobium meliloti]MDX0022285.1 tyrosine-type recombinase/integrase [Sinorhizobium meliloti]MDX0457343.1 tyrosine-type recombinase/integrase [Sinorhizobium medicae]